MRSLLSCAILGLLSFGAALADEPLEETQSEIPPKSPNIQVKVDASFTASEIFGVKLVNGLDTETLLTFNNDEPTEVTVQGVGGHLWTPVSPNYQTPYIVRNLSLSRYDTKIPAGEKATVSYKFRTELHPQDLRLQLWAVVMDPKYNLFQLEAYNETVTIVEAPTSIFDPQIIFLYLVLASVFAGTCYFIYTTWISTLFPQTTKKRSGKSGAPRTPRKADPADAASTGETDGSAVTTGAKGYDVSWIPEHHLKRPEAKRARSSGTPASAKKKGATSP